MNTFTQQGHIELIESGSKDLYLYILFQHNVLSIYYLERKALIKSIRSTFSALIIINVNQNILNSKILKILFKSIRVNMYLSRTGFVIFGQCTEGLRSTLSRRRRNWRIRKNTGEKSAHKIGS